MEDANFEHRDELFRTFANWFDELAAWFMEHFLHWAALWQVVGLAAMAVAAYF